MLVVEDRSIEDACQITGMTADAMYQWRNRLQKLARQIRTDILSENEAARRIPNRG